MSKIQVNEIVNHFDNGAPDCPKGLTITGVVTATTFSGSVETLNIDSVGIITAQSGVHFGLVGSGLTISSVGTGTSMGFFTDGSEALRIDSSGNLRFNSGYGSVATAYGCRAWVKFDGTGTVAIIASGNVSSITDNGTGDYTVNFTTAMPDANYSFSGSGGSDGHIFAGRGTGAGQIPTTTTLRVTLRNPAASAVDDTVSVAVFR